jgi:DeoR/GlpR family transcriptional regulator of sugar metabolism
MFAHTRHFEILQMLKKRPQMSAGELVEALGVSSATIRRDLAELSRTGHVLRTHGGVIVRDPILNEPSLGEKAAVAIKEKKQIADRVAREVPDGATVFIDGGTTCLQAGLMLRKRPGLTIITNSLPLIAAHEGFEAKLIVLGGERRAVSGALTGTIAVEALFRLRADIAFVGASGLHIEEGVGTTELSETEIKREWIRRSAKAYLLADATKWNAGSMIRFAEWNEFHALVTDRPPPRGFKSKSLNIMLT